MKNKKVLIVSMLILAVFFVVVYIYNSTKVENKKSSIVFGISPFPDTYMPYLGKIKGWYAEEGLDVNFRILGWTEIQESLASGASNRIDMGINNISAIVATYNKNPDFIYFYGFNTFDDGFALMIRPNSDLKPLTYFLDDGMSHEDAVNRTGMQLKGKTVITTANTDMEQGVSAIAKKGGLDFLKDIKIINLNSDDGLTAFLAGEGDAYIGGIPQRNKAKQQGMIEMITGTDLGPAPINGIVSTKKFYETNKEDLLKILRVWFKIVEYTNENIDEVASLMVAELNKHTGTKIPPEEFKEYWNNYEHYPATPLEIEREILDPSGKNYWKARWDDCNEYFYSIKKVIPYKVNPEDAFYMEKVHKAFLEKYGSN